MKKLVLVCSLSILSNAQMEAVTLQRVILSTNCNRLYRDFWPIVAPLWQAMGLKPTLILVNEENCPIDESLGDVIQFKPLHDVPIAEQAQVLRLLVPALFPDDLCLISDIDMIPISLTYFTEGAALCTNENAFMVYKNEQYARAKTPLFKNRWPMCYVAAKGRIFSQIFGASRIEDFPAVLRSLHALGHGWHTDEKVMYTFVKKWEAEKGGVIWLKGDGSKYRINRANPNYMKALKTGKLELGKMIDFHAPRPYAEHVSEINALVAEIYKQWARQKGQWNVAHSSRSKNDVHRRA